MGMSISGGEHHGEGRAIMNEAVVEVDTHAAVALAHLSVFARGSFQAMTGDRPQTRT